MTSPPRRAHVPSTWGTLAVTGVLAGGLLGATTNAVNGRVSPLYFVTVPDWHDVADDRRAAIAQGSYEGLLSLAFTTATGIIAGAACPYGHAVR